MSKERLRVHATTQVRRRKIELNVTAPPSCRLSVVCGAIVVQRFVLFFIRSRLIMERKVIRSAAREVILKVKEFCELEKKNSEVLIPLQNAQMRVAAMTGVSVKTVSRITKEGKIAMATSKKIVTPGKSRPQPKKIDLDDFDMCCIRQKIHFFYVVKKELPTVNKLRLELKRDINFQGSNTTLRRILKQLGFRFKRCQSKRKVLMERFDITAWRARYIERMRKNRRNINRKNKSTEEELSNSDCDMSGIKELYHDDHNYCIKLY